MCAARLEAIRESGPGAYLHGFLDEMIPLRDASHADVVSYSVQIPMRYARCFAELADGRSVGLREENRFVGWIGHRPCESLLFRSKGLHITLDVAEDCGDGPIQCVSVKAERLLDVTHRVRKFIGIDGSLVRVAAG